MIKGFKDFMMRGNAIELAVAFVIGAAFTAFVTSITDNLLQPIIGLALGGGVDAGTLTIDGQTINFTAMINAFITFFLTALVVYLVFVYPMMKYQGRHGKTSKEDEEEEVVLLREIRDALAGENPKGTPETGTPDAE